VFYLLASQPVGSMVRDLLVILAVAGLVGVLLRRLHLAVIPGYLLAGALIGPHAIGLVRDAQATGSITQIATILLMFTLGLHMDLTRLRGGLGRLIGVTIVSALASALICWPICRILGLSWPGSLAASMAFTISSTAVVIRVLMQRGELEQVHGRLTFGVLVVQDLLAMIMLALLPLLALWNGAKAPGDEPLSLVSILSASSLAIGGVAAMIVVGRLLLPKLLREAASDGSGEVLLVVSSAVALGSAALTSILKLSPELGAFLAGFLLAGTSFRYQLAGQLVPLRNLFMAVFFTAIGMDVPVDTVVKQWWVLALFVPAMIVAKALTTGVSAWALGVSPAVAAISGVALAQGGEFSLVMLRVAKDLGLASDDAYGLMVAAIVLSLMVTPVLMGWSHALGHRVAHWPHVPWLRSAVWGVKPMPTATPDAARDSMAQPSDSHTDQAIPDHPGHVIIAGFGPVGSAVADELERKQIPIVIIDLNPKTITKHRGMGRTVIFGDASNHDVLASAGLERAQALVLTMPDEDAVLRACRAARAIKPDIFIAARALYLSRALRVMQEGADHTVVEEMATAEVMAQQVMIKLRMRSEGIDSSPRLYAIET
jgi:monovalent cation:H+ antiporter-2, CPA2 family